ncbi:MAG TPA: protein YgfX [Gallionella sp.]|nr:protein YgfX [Gallionella sp.]
MAIKPSPRLAMLLLLFHAIAAIVAYMTVMPLAARLVMLMLILLSLFYYQARDALLLLPDSWCGISFDQGSVSVVTRGGSCFSGRIANNTTVSPYFAVLCVRPEGHRLPVFRAIFPDALDTGEFRELSVYLKFAQ